MKKQEVEWRSSLWMRRGAKNKSRLYIPHKLHENLEILRFAVTAVFIVTGKSIHWKY